MQRLLTASARLVPLAGTALLLAASHGLREVVTHLDDLARRITKVG